jgi:hypothetical protein
MFGLVGVAMTLSANPCAAGGDPFLGEIDTFPYNFCPVGWGPTQRPTPPVQYKYRPVFAAGDNLWRRWKSDLRIADRKTGFHVNTGSAGDPMHLPDWHFPEPILTGCGAQTPAPFEGRRLFVRFCGLILPKMLKHFGAIDGLRK